MSVKNKKIEYTIEYKNERFPTILGSERRLRNFGVLTNDKSRYEFIKWLNRTRNLTIFTHGVYSCSKQDAEKAISKMEVIASQIEGNYRWKAIKKNFEPLKIKPKLIFSKFHSANSYCRSIAIAEL